MASSSFIGSHLLYSSCNGKTHSSSFKKASFSIPSSYKLQNPSCFERGVRFSTIRATASDSKTGRKQVEVVYDLEDKFNKLADEVDKNSGISRLTLFSPCKINVFLRITGKREDGYHDLASLFHVNTYIVQIVEDIPKPLPFNLPLVLIKPQEACSTAEVYKHLTLDRTSKVDPLTLLEKISRNGISQDVCINDLEPPAFEVLPSLKRLKQRLVALGRGQYDAVFMSGSGSTIVGVGSPDPPQFVYDDEEYKDVFLSEASFITRVENQWYTEVPMDASSSSSMEFSRSIE
ncbi:4-diphosphocytidyl-2-C-methyl-D-erythritol kinase, chloroplastic-like [Olea europaea var. sylvestris]|uniref:4-diphosphocytidyl-2-C-methyl-D-erythritol kinase, chloroplastic-like n=1 Tax=Olea europaea var. sylvestris TaxID=158386 RepID=UPI000C1D445D|nr:4-diphosphocytidyl-2-C-methyl-D-erythritol kinase, chloroplastic-like [Olea europaea var. sylvestris]